MTICEELGGLPLALDQAGAYIEETPCSLSEYQRLYRTRRAELLRIRGDLIGDHPKPVTTTWSLSFQRVEEKDGTAADLLRCCAYLAPDTIPEEMILKAGKHLGSSLQMVTGDPFVLNQAITALSAYSLIHRDVIGETLSVHRLVQAVVRDQMDEQSRQQWAQRGVRAVNAAFPEVEHQTWPQCDRLLPHALLCAELIAQEQMDVPEAARLLNQTGHYLYERARYMEAEPLLKQTLSIDEQQLGAQHPNTANSLNNLTALYQAQGKYEQAEPLSVRALAIREQQLGAQHPNTASSLNNLALLYRNQGKDEQAEPLFLRALQIREQQLGPDHPNTAQSLHNLALFYKDQGKDEQAEPLYQHALAIRKQQLGPQHPDTAVSMWWLAVLSEQQQQYGKAASLYQRALSIDKRTLGPQHPTTQTIRANYTRLLRTMGHDAEAAALDQP